MADMQWFMMSMIRSGKMISETQLVDSISNFLVFCHFCWTFNGAEMGHQSPLAKRRPGKICQGGPGAQRLAAVRAEAIWAIQTSETFFELAVVGSGFSSLPAITSYLFRAAQRFSS